MGLGFFFLFYNIHKVCCAKLLKATRNALSFTDLFFSDCPLDPSLNMTVTETTGQLGFWVVFSQMSLNCFHSWCLQSLRAAALNNRLQLRPCPQTGCASLEHSTHVSGDLVQAIPGPAGPRPKLRDAEDQDRHHVSEASCKDPGS